MSRRDIHIVLREGLKNLCGAKSTVTMGTTSGDLTNAYVDAYPRAYEAQPNAGGELQWEIVFFYGEAKNEAVLVTEERFCSTCWLLRSMMKANGITSRRAVRRLLRQQGGIK